MPYNYCFLLYAPAELSVPLFQHLLCLVHYYRDEFTNEFCEKVVGLCCKFHSMVANSIGVSAFHVPCAPCWTNLELVY